MKVISLTASDIGQYDVPFEAGVMAEIGSGYAWWPETLDMTTFNTNHGCVTLEIARNTVKSYSVNSVALEAYNAAVLEATRSAVIAKMSATCNAMIVDGVEVEMDDGTKKKFALTDQDQANISNMFDTIRMGAKKYLYHEDDGNCTWYTASEILKMYVAMNSSITYHTTYNNSIKQWIKRETNLEVLNSMTYGMELPSDLKATFDQNISEAAEIVQQVVETLTQAMSA